MKKTIGLSYGQRLGFVTIDSILDGLVYTFIVTNIEGDMHFSLLLSLDSVGICWQQSKAAPGAVFITSIIAKHISH